MHPRTTCGLVAATVTLCCFAYAAPEAGGGGIAARHFEQFRQAFPRARVFEWGNRPNQLSGAVFATGADSRDSAESFLREHAGVFGVSFEDLRPGVWYDDGPSAKGLMYQPERDDYKLMLERYSQYEGGVPVFRSEVKLAVRNEPGFPLVLVNANLRDLGDFRLPANTDALAGRVAIDRIATQELGNGARVTWGPEAVIWAGEGAMLEEARLAVQFRAERGVFPDITNYAHRLYVVDVETGVILYEEDQVHNVDVTGNVSANITDGFRSDECDPLALMPMPYARVNIGGTVAFADANGDFTIPNAGNTDVTVESRVWGTWFRSLNFGGATPLLSQVVTPPGPADFEHNDSGSEFTTAEVNAYVEANNIRDWVKLHDPDFPVDDAAFPLHVNSGGTCNAFYQGGNLLFLRAAGGGGCPNTAFSSIVYHEYGHHLVARATGAQCEWGEGNSDITAVVYSDEPELAWGFFGNCDSPLRNADNTCQYDAGSCSTCGGPCHNCGQLISGCVWDLRNELLVTEPADYRAITTQLWLASLFMHSTGQSITPADAQNYVIADDDDAVPENGSPHWDEINTAFSAHNMAPPPLVLTEFAYPNGRPAAIDPSGGTTMRVVITPLTADPIPGTGMLHYGTGEGFFAVPMTVVSDNVYDAVFPAYPCGTKVLYYLSVDTDANRIQNDPVDAPDVTYEALSGVSAAVTFADDFEANMGWTIVNENVTAGAWERGLPDGLVRAPFEDGDGSGQCYVTGLDRTMDLDGGPTRLISPTLDMSNGVYTMSYLRWAGGIGTTNDTLEIEISNDNGGNWTSIEIVPTVNAPEWTLVEVDPLAFIAGTSTMQVRFNMTDPSPDTTCEGGVDGFSLTEVDCGEPSGRVLPDSFTVLLGDEQEGVLEHLYNSDDGYLVIGQRAALTPLLPNIRLEVQGTSATDTSSQLTFTLEASASALPPMVPQRIQMFNYDTNAFEMVDDRLATLSDSVVDVVITTDPDRFLQSGTGETKSRINWFDPGNLFSVNWAVSVDQIVWQVD